MRALPPVAGPGPEDPEAGPGPMLIKHPSTIGKDGQVRTFPATGKGFTDEYLALIGDGWKPTTVATFTNSKAKMRQHAWTLGQVRQRAPFDEWEFELLAELEHRPEPPYPIAIIRGTTWWRWDPMFQAARLIALLDYIQADGDHGVPYEVEENARIKWARRTRGTT